jgi:hypothetical protein
MLMRINHDGVGFADQVERRPRVRRQIARQREVAAVGRVHMQTESILIAQPQNLRQ